MFTLATDTSCDVLRNELDAAGIAWVPLTYTIDGETNPDDFTRDEQYKDFYAKVRGGAMPSTSQINTFVQEEFLEKLVSNGATLCILRFRADFPQRIRRRARRRKRCANATPNAK